MSTFPLISFIVTLYQQAPFIHQNISSVLNQSVADLELIVIDDGSTDGGAEIVRAARDQRVRLIQHLNQGPSAALNAGLRTCRGRYIALLGGSDVSLPERGRAQIDILESQDADIVFSLPILIDEKDRRLDPSACPAFFGTSLAEFHQNALLTFFRNGDFLCASSACFRRTLLEQIGEFSTGLAQLQCFEYWIRIARRGFKSLVSTDPAVEYRRHYGDRDLSSNRKSARTRVEYNYIMRRFFDGCEPSLLLDLLRRDGPYNFGFTRHEVVLMKALIYMSHADREVREIGYHLAMELLDMGPAARCEAARVGLRPPTLFDVMLADGAKDEGRLTEPRPRKAR